jgi:hypothetical protein
MKWVSRMGYSFRRIDRESWGNRVRQLIQCVRGAKS